MGPTDRLEDRRRDWQAFCEAAIGECASRLAKHCPAGEPSADAGKIDNGIRDWAAHLLDDCLAWLGQTGMWQNSEKSRQLAREQLTAALQELPPFSYHLPEPALSLPLRSWAIAAACGAALGMLLCSPLSWLVLGQREVGLFLGGVLGAAGFATLIGFLAQAPTVRAAVSYALAASAAGSLTAGVWAFWRQRSTGWLRTSAGFLAAWLVVVLARPRPVNPPRELCRSQCQAALKLHLEQVADLVLAWCWAHPDRLEAGAAAVENSGGLDRGPSGAVYSALAGLYSQLASGTASPQDIQDSVEELFQRCEEDGYEWRMIDAGTPFGAEMKADFGTFGSIQAGAPVRTRRPAIRRHGELVQKGELRRLVETTPAETTPGIEEESP